MTQQVKIPFEPQPQQTAKPARYRRIVAKCEMCGAQYDERGFATLRQRGLCEERQSPADVKIHCADCPCGNGLHAGLQAHHGESQRPLWLTATELHLAFCLAGVIR